MSKQSRTCFRHHTTFAASSTDALLLIPPLLHTQAHAHADTCVDTNKCHTTHAPTGAGAVPPLFTLTTPFADSACTHTHIQNHTTHATPDAVPPLATVTKPLADITHTHTRIHTLIHTYKCHTTRAPAGAVPPPATVTTPPADSAEAEAAATAPPSVAVEVDTVEMPGPPVTANVIIWDSATVSASGCNLAVAVWAQ